MAPRRRRQDSPLQKLVKTIIPILPIVFIILIVSVLTLLFEYLPQRSDEKQSLSQIGEDLIFKRTRDLILWLSPAVEFLAQHSSAWVPLWCVNAPKGIIDPRFPPVQQLDADAVKVQQLLTPLKDNQYFRIFKVDLQQECPFWARDDMCVNPTACSVCECDDNEVPLPWRMKPTEDFVNREHMSDYSPWEDSHSVGHERGLLSSLAGETEAGKPTFVDLSLNPPGYTAFRGRNIWNLIYRENCIDKDGTSSSFVGSNNQCTEEMAFYKIVSGMQTNIMVLAAEYYKPRKTPKEIHKPGVSRRSLYKYDLDIFKNRVAWNEEWISNLYFTFATLLKTLGNVRPILREVSCDTGNPASDEMARQQLTRLLNENFATNEPKYQVGVYPIFDRKQSLALSQFQNISRIMDCLECEKCRLHGKVKLAALQLAIRSNGPEGRIHSLERNELIALINALDYFSDAVMAVKRFETRLSALRYIWGGGFFILVIMAATWFSGRSFSDPEKAAIVDYPSIKHPPQNITESDDDVTSLAHKMRHVQLDEPRQRRAL